MRINERRSLWRRLRPYFTVFDVPLMLIICALLSVGLVTLYSAGIGIPGKVEDQLRNICLAFMVMWFVANVSPQMMMRIAVPAYVIAVALLIGVALFGTIKLGARRWLHVGIDIQPSEFMKIAMPLMLAWFFQQRAGHLRWQDYGIAAVLLAIPVGLIVKQPDLGTALLVVAAGFCVIFLAGLAWKALIALFVAAAASLPVIWSVMHDYQRERVMTLIDPTSDPLGKGFHIIQSTIAVGSGGMTGKGWTHGTQAHLEFIPERTTDFIFAVFSEEFGLTGNLVLMFLYLLLIGRGLMIAGNAPNFFTRLLAGAVTMIYFTYAFVNMGMVSGILPVVGVPLPFMSYGGTALLTLGLGAGILMSIQRHRKLVQT
ncbi:MULTISPECIES: rod shape-determining protein RodA [unclassified Duganella]|uniref:rod shape-determining protein RodA n=1 Tax=unclassified Duganella TaxID=2636909 RepID=UPI000E342E34|nr:MULTISPECIES: rod shape-determining protein RodA [unclassified Duganella]RFP10623.1 rod shape-determining protein RodA [Duganella sp. BJB475]RFP27350.1 rod shape-determining protein RodA [Duganella sp. BJB476]